MDLDYSYFIITAIFFIIGFLISSLIKSKNTKHKDILLPKIDNLEIIEVIENRKQLQIDTIMHKVNNLQIKLDLVESALSQFSKMSSIPIVI